MAKKYIDADLLRKEIEFAKTVYDNPNRVVHGVADAFRQDGRAAMCDDILKKIDTLSEEPDKGLVEEVKRYYSDNFAYISSDQPTLSILTNVARHFAEWAFRQGWTFDAHKGAFGICFDGNIDNLLDSLKDKEDVTVQIRKK